MVSALTFCVQCIEDKNILERKPTVAVKFYDFQELNAEQPLGMRQWNVCCIKC